MALAVARVADVHHAAAGGRACSRSSARRTPSRGWCAGWCRRPALLAEKAGLAAVCSVGRLPADARGPGAVRGPRLGPLPALARRPWRWARSRSRRSAWRSARSRARCGRPRCWRSCSALPLAFLALVPSGAVAPALYDVIRAVSAVFPFKPGARRARRGAQRRRRPRRPAAAPGRRSRWRSGRSRRLALRRFA